MKNNLSIDKYLPKWEKEWKQQRCDDREVFHFKEYLLDENPWESSPLRMLDYIETLSRYKFITYKQFILPTRFIRCLENWLANFENQDKYIAFTLASRVFFLSERESDYIQIYIYKKFLSQYHISLKECLFVSLEEDVKVTEFFTLNNISGYKDRDEGIPLSMDVNFLLEPIKKFERCNWASKKIESYNLDKELKEFLLSLIKEKRIQIKGEIEKLKNQLRHKRYLILLTDLSASGLTASNDIRRFLKNYHFKIVFFLPFILCEDSYKRLKQLNKQYNKKLKVIYGLLLSSRFKCLSDDSILFSEKDRKKIKNLCGKYFERLKGHPDIKKWAEEIKYGYKDTQLTLVRYRNCPNNTLPLIWAENENWKALFPRNPSYKKHMVGGKK